MSKATKQLIVGIGLIVVLGLLYIMLRPSVDTHVLTGGEVEFRRTEDFGLAVSADQVLVEAFIPPCESGFDYCLYYQDDKYAGSNFDSAGLRIKLRKDLKSETSCLSVPPAGYLNLNPEIERSESYVTSTFSHLHNAATGHYSDGTMYRLFYNSNCYEFETRIATSQIANYEPGLIEEFSENDREHTMEELRNLLSRVRLVSDKGQQIFP